MTDMNEIITTVTEQTGNEEFMDSLNSLIPMDEDDESESSGVSAMEVFKTVQTARQTLTDAWKFYGWTKRKITERVIRAEERKKERENKPSLTESIKNKFTNKTETTESTEVKETVETPKSAFESMTLEQIMQMTQALETAKQQKIQEFETAKANLDEQLKMLK